MTDYSNATCSHGDSLPILGVIEDECISSAAWHTYELPELADEPDMVTFTDAGINPNHIPDHRS